MTAGRADASPRLAAFAVILAAPSLALLLALVLFGKLSPASALLAGVLFFGFSSLLVGRLERARRAQLEAIAALEAGTQEAVRLEQRLDPFGAELSFALLRLARLSKGRLETQQSRLAALEAVLSAVPEPLLLIDAARRIVRANKAAALFVGEITEPRDLASAVRNPALLDAVEAVLHGAETEVVEFALFFPVERRLRARIARIGDPGDAVLRTESEPASTPSGQSLSVQNAVAVLAFDDITELKRAEAARVDFVANASHELRTPLAAFVGFIETLQGPAREDKEARERFLAIMQREANRMARLVADLLSLSRIEQSEHMPPEGSLALAPMLRDVAEALALRAGERGMRIGLELAPDLPEIPGDADGIVQVFHNLLDNAIKYGRAGTAITVEAAPVERRPRAGGSGLAPYVRVAVKDEGEGIPREHLPRLTERFYRVDSARSRELGGTGLGLAIVKHVLNRHRGFLEIKSEPGKGSVFSVYLPQTRRAGTAL